MATYKMFPERSDGELLRLWNDDAHRMTVGPVLEVALQERGYTTRQQDGTLRFPLTELIRDEPATPGSERELQLYSERDANGGKRTVWLCLTEEGRLSLEGQDLGAPVSAVYGSDFGEYEWAWAPTSEQLPILLDRLGVPADSTTLLEDVGRQLQALGRSEAESCFKEAGAEFWNRVGVDW